MGTCDGAYTLGILTVANALANVDVNMLGAFENFIIDDLRCSDVNISRASSSSFSVGPLPIISSSVNPALIRSMTAYPRNKSSSGGG